MQVGVPANAQADSRKQTGGSDLAVLADAVHTPDEEASEKEPTEAGSSSTPSPSHSDLISSPASLD